MIVISERVKKKHLSNYYNWVYHLVPYYFNEKDRIHLVTTKKQFSNTIQQLRMERLGVPGEYTSSFIPNFLYKQFKNKGRLVNMYDIDFRIPPHLLSKKMLKTPLYLV